MSMPRSTSGWVLVVPGSYLMHVGMLASWKAVRPCWHQGWLFDWPVQGLGTLYTHEASEFLDTLSIFQSSLHALRRSFSASSTRFSSLVSGSDLHGGHTTATLKAPRPLEVKERMLQG